MCEHNYIMEEDWENAFVIICTKCGDVIDRDTNIEKFNENYTISYTGKEA